jgi:hypothetical protein
MCTPAGISLLEMHLASFFCIFLALDTREKNEKNKNKNLPVLYPA